MRCLHGASFKWRFPTDLCAFLLQSVNAHLFVGIHTGSFAQKELPQTRGLVGSERFQQFLEGSGLRTTMMVPSSPTMRTKHSMLRTSCRSVADTIFWP
jgi:hypothetical protein